MLGKNRQEPNHVEVDRQEQGRQGTTELPIENRRSRGQEATWCTAWTHAVQQHAPIRGGQDLMLRTGYKENQ